MLLVAVLAVATVTLYWFGVAGQRFGWLTAPLVLSGAGGALAWLLFLRHPRRTAVIATVAVVGVAVGVALRVATPAMPSRLAGAVGSVELPAGATLVETREFGNALCFDSCPSLIHRYAVPGQAQEVERMLAAAFRSDGWSVVPDRYVVRSFTALSPDEAVEAQVTVAPEPMVEPGEEHDEQLPTLAAGHVLVEVNVRANPCPPGRPGCP
ncbi:MAG: hypothetical protein KY469_14280 [Actinobacteria bacterium]|nr:hypothetical protein [Actinomycetota bacterium]